MSSYNDLKKKLKTMGSEAVFENSVLLNIDIKLSEDETTTLTIYPNDVIEDKVLSFCKEHNLSSQAKAVLNQQVIDQLDEKIAECM